MLKICLYQGYNVPLCRHIKTQNYRTYQSNTIYGQSKYSINAEDNTDIGTLISGMVSLTEKKASLNGNISSIIWRDSTQTASRGYKFTYDSMNRLTDAVYGEGSSLSENPDRYSERGMTYTKNGALTRLLRYGRRNTDDFGLIDSLVMTLDGNRVLSVSDGAGSLVYENSFDFKSNGRSDVYEYDGNGSLTNDPNKGFAFEYDLLGNPKSAISSYINNYTYSCSGDKLRVYSHFNGCIAKPPYFYWGWDEDDGGAIWDDDGSDIEDDDKSVYTASSNNSDIFQEWRDASNPRDTEYCGLFLFEHSILDKFLFDGGYCTFKDGEASFHYYLQDHLGNNRAVICEDGTIEQTTEYYPFGGIYGDVSTNPGLQPYKYNGKEFDHIEGLDLYDYGARQYDPALAVWTSVDPLADEYGDVSPYVYCLNNPVRLVDYKGMAPGDFFLTIDKAAIDFGLYYNDNSIRERTEYGSTIIKVVNKKGQKGYTYTVANRGNGGDVDFSNAPFGYKTVADIHTHGHCTENDNISYYDNDFSGMPRDDGKNIDKSKDLRNIRNYKDIGNANRRQRDSYLVTPNGSLKKYSPKTGKVTLISEEMPSDYNDSSRVNNKSSLIETNPIKMNTELLQQLKILTYGHY